MKYILKKNKQAFVTLLLLLCIMQVFAQTAEFNHKKYWYLRWRLKNYFMVVGEGPGKSLPAGILFAFQNYIIKLSH